MLLAYCIICLQNTYPVKPVLRHKEAILSANQTTAISTLDVSLAYATSISRLPHDSSTYVTFDLAIDKDEGIVIEGYEVYWNVRQANLRLMELVKATMMDIVKGKVESKLESEGENDKAASVRLRVPVLKRNVWWEAVQMNTEA
jgi:hypothetical protein